MHVKVSIKKTLAREPMISDLCHPNVYFLLAFLWDNFIANIDIKNPIKSVAK